MRRAIGLSFAVIAVLASPAAYADDPDAGAAPPEDAGAPKIWTSCVEHVPQGATRPKLDEVFPARGFSGYAANLEITVTHGKGETVLPQGFKVQSGTDAFKAISEAHFVIPDPDGGAGPSLTTEPRGDGASTKLVIPFVPLPKEAGRSGLVLPPVPIAIARASGELMTLCTRPHPIVVDDPIANEVDPKVKPNPPPRPQREDWALARHVTYGLLGGALIGVLGGLLLRRWLRRPKVVIAPPPRPPWIVALEELEAVRRSRLLEEGRAGEYFDRVSDCVRKYLGARYGFDGLETTTDEMRALLKRVRPAVPAYDTITTFLEDCDLVKFARVEPAETDCVEALRRGETIVRATTPVLRDPPAQRRPEASP